MCTTVEVRRILFAAGQKENVPHFLNLANKRAVAAVKHRKASCRGSLAGFRDLNAGSDGR